MGERRSHSKSNGKNRDFFSKFHSLFILLMDREGPIDSYNEQYYTHIMSKRLQVLLPEEDFQELEARCEADGCTIAEFVRTSIKSSLQKPSRRTPEDRIARILGYARYDGPSGDIETVLAEIEQGKSM